MSRIIAASGSQRVSVADLDLDPLGIVDINTDFWYHAQNRSCFSFFETYQTGFKALAYGEGLVIDKWSSTMGLAGETTAAMNTDHQGMTRFEDQNDPNYRLLRNALAYTIRQINTEGKVNKSRTYSIFLTQSHSREAGTNRSRARIRLRSCLQTQRQREEIWKIHGRQSRGFRII